MQCKLNILTVSLKLQLFSHVYHFRFLYIKFYVPFYSFILQCHEIFLKFLVVGLLVYSSPNPLRTVLKSWYHISHLYFSGTKAVISKRLHITMLQ